MSLIVCQLSIMIAKFRKELELVTADIVTQAHQKSALQVGLISLNLGSNCNPQQARSHTN